MALKILIAEDDKDLVDLYRTIFEGRGHEVMITNNGMDCQNVYKRYTKQPDGKIKPYFDVVILDQKMMGMDGIETAKEIQKVIPKQKIIFITGYGNELLLKLTQLSENPLVMNKPLTLQALLTEVEGFAVTKFREMAKNRQITT
ncbi:MAG TPA: response regulator [Candidatus Nitrosotalea sp.]|nr:response regulator [Candidatus Nitrosotalea sp.]